MPSQTATTRAFSVGSWQVTKPMGEPDPRTAAAIVPTLAPSPARTVGYPMTAAGDAGIGSWPTEEHQVVNSRQSDR